jgi:hypothetical protein
VAPEQRGTSQIQVASVQHVGMYTISDQSQAASTASAPAPYKALLPFSKIWLPSLLFSLRHSFSLLLFRTNVPSSSVYAHVSPVMLAPASAERRGHFCDHIYVFPYSIMKHHS